MDNLICHTNNCEHNVKARCTAGIVNVSEKGVCTSKIKREGGVLAQTFADIEAAEDFGLHGAIENTVTCSSMNCVHNDGGVCCADHIVVEDGLPRTKCFTRTVKK